MSEGNIAKFKLDKKNPPRLGKTQAQRLDAMSDEEIEQVALSDRDNPLLTDEEFEAFERVPDAQLPARPAGSLPPQESEIGMRHDL